MSNTLTCVYCGQAYPEGTPPHGSDVLTQHIRVCTKHPLREAEQKIALLEQERDGAYLERNQVVAALAMCFPSVVTKTAIEGWDPAWHNCVYIQLPTGQASWHFHDREAHLFEKIQKVDSHQWDGHTTEEKYKRLAALESQGRDAERYRAIKSAFEQKHCLIFQAYRNCTANCTLTNRAEKHESPPYWYHSGDSFDHLADKVIAENRARQ